MDIIHDLKHYLPSQTPLKDFIHHNSLHAFQEYTFFDAIFKASKIFGYQVTLPLNDYRSLYEQGRIKDEVINRILYNKGLRPVSDWKEKLLKKEYETDTTVRVGELRAIWKKIYQVDLDSLVQPLLFRIVCSYLDQGISLWQFPSEDKGLLPAIKDLEINGYASFFKTKRAKALLLNPSTTLEKLLSIVVGNESYNQQYLIDQQFCHRGWSGIVSAIEDNPHSLLYAKKISLHDFIMLELLLEIDNLDATLGEQNWKGISKFMEAPTNYFEDVPKTELQEVLTLWQEAFEWSYYNEIISGLKAGQTATNGQDTGKPSFQAIFCIDEREDSLRRHIEYVDQKCETLGCPGFFGVEFFFKPEGGKFYEKLCPAPVTPKYLIKETKQGSQRHHETLYNQRTHSIEGFAMSLILGFWAAIKMILMIFRPKMSPAISDAFTHMHMDGDLHIENVSIEDRENDLQVGFTIVEMATRVENLLRGIGLTKNFATIVYVVAHGSSSANNPHHGAHDCGACSGRPGSVNARVFAFMANHKEVRKILADKGLIIPDLTQFVGALHDTAADEIAYYDTQLLYPENKLAHTSNVKNFETALDLNAKERSRRFASIDSNQDIAKIRKAIKDRSVSMFEPRPELGHGTNALVFIGNRKITKNLFLDRRAFMNSYDHSSDPDGNLLLGVIRPIPPVCGGINLEYYFSRVDNYKLGAGTKLPHNVMGLIGVANSSDGDLRPGLPLQMIEVHDPVRLLIFVEQKPDIVLKTIQREDSLYQWFTHGWVHLMAINPDDNEFYYFANHKFEKYLPIPSQISTMKDLDQIILDTREMPTNHITDATRENLPIKVLTH